MWVSDCPAHRSLAERTSEGAHVSEVSGRATPSLEDPLGGCYGLRPWRLHVRPLLHHKRPRRTLRDLLGRTPQAQPWSHRRRRCPACGASASLLLSMLSGPTRRGSQQHATRNTSQPPSVDVGIRGLVLSFFLVRWLARQVCLVRRRCPRHVRGVSSLHSLRQQRRPSQRFARAGLGAGSFAEVLCRSFLRRARGQRQWASSLMMCMRPARLRQSGAGGSAMLASCSSGA